MAKSKVEPKMQYHDHTLHKVGPMKIKEDRKCIIVNTSEKFRFRPNYEHI